MENITGYIRKLGIRPLLIPAVLIFAVMNLFGDHLIRSASAGDRALDIVVTSRISKLSGKSTYYGRAEGIGRIRIISDEELFAGDLISAECKVTEVEGPSNPGEFDYQSYLLKKGIRYEAKVKRIEKLDCCFPGRIIYHIRYGLRDIAGKHLLRILDDKDGPVLSALCLGDTSLLSDETQKDFSLSGCSHLLAVSGTHFSSFLLIIPFLLKKLEKKQRLLVSGIFIIITGFLTGWTESVTRAAVVSVCNLHSRDTLSGMCFAAVLMMVADPFASRSSGFQMSFCAALGIYFLAEKIRNKTGSSLLAATFASYAALMPFYLTEGLSIGVVTLAVRIIAVVLIEFVCALFIPGLILSWISPVTLYPSILFSRIVAFLMSVGRDHYYDSILLRGSLWIIGGVILLLVFYKIFSRRSIKIISLLTAVSLIAFGLFGSLGSDTAVIFLDVGQGDCCLIMSCGRSMLIDGGTTEEGRKVLPDVLDHYKIRSVDYSVLTHLDEDHKGGIMYLNDIGRSGKIITSVTGVGENVKRGDIIRVGKVDLKIIAPDDTTETGENPDSLVGIISYAKTSILMTGDIDQEKERELIEKGLISDVDILKVAHHGSRTSTSREFLKASSPEVCVISVALYNNYGHPSEETMERLGEVEANTYLTSKNGAIIVKIQKDRYKITCFKE
ncbi:MAG: DNA internalization-related competence protein ComEC/Rec2 [Clostridiales bacterium]|nr:DNA internalization-related competence protein ComEC/Rec2 [Clostridiales bacterium]